MIGFTRTRTIRGIGLGVTASLLGGFALGRNRYRSIGWCYVPTVSGAGVYFTGFNQPV